MADDPDIPLLPYDADSYIPTPQKPGEMTLGADFKYIGEAHTVESFKAYCAGYHFGSVPPDYVVVHHTANPDASWAPISPDPRTKWDRSEAGATEAQIQTKRKAQLDGIKNYYQNALGWDRGPHLFVDDRWIWLFTPMYEVGIHAASGNSYHDRAGKLHYSIGVEAIGYYENTVWPAPVARNVGMAIAILKKQLGTFELVYKSGPHNVPAAHVGSLCSHRDFNKPACPGKAITEAYYTGVAQAARKELTGA